MSVDAMISVSETYETLFRRFRKSPTILIIPLDTDIRQQSKVHKKFIVFCMFRTIHLSFFETFVVSGCFLSFFFAASLSKASQFALPKRFVTTSISLPNSFVI